MTIKVCFDCDSTLVTIEGIDELARDQGLEAQIIGMTNQAMTGEIDLEEVFGLRMEMVKPSAKALAWLGELYHQNLVPDVVSTIKTLHEMDCEVHIVSGGLRPAVLLLAEYLSIPSHQVHAVEVEYDHQGCYVGFEADSPLIKATGKLDICRQFIGGANSPIFFIGDGMTDAAVVAKDIIFIQYAGVVDRPTVQSRANYRIHNLRQLPELIGKLSS